MARNTGTADNYYRSGQRSVLTGQSLEGTSRKRVTVRPNRASKPSGVTLPIGDVHVTDAQQIAAVLTMIVKGIEAGKSLCVTAPPRCNFLTRIRAALDLRVRQGTFTAEQANTITLKTVDVPQIVQEPVLAVQDAAVAEPVQAAVVPEPVQGTDITDYAAVKALGEQQKAVEALLTETDPPIDPPDDEEDEEDEGD
jgi:hypothetical protein